MGYEVLVATLKKNITELCKKCRKKNQSKGSRSSNSFMKSKGCHVWDSFRLTKRKCNGDMNEGYEIRHGHIKSEQEEVFLSPPEIQDQRPSNEANWKEFYSRQKSSSTHIRALT